MLIAVSERQVLHFITGRTAENGSEIMALGFLRSPITNMSSEFEYSRWQIRYGGCQGLCLFISGQTWPKLFNGVTNYESIVKISEIGRFCELQSMLISELASNVRSTKKWLMLYKEMFSWTYSTIYSIHMSDGAAPMIGCQVTGPILIAGQNNPILWIECGFNFLLVRLFWCINWTKYLR